MRRLTVIGTDTGIGKTYVTKAIVEAADGTARRVFALKPIESGTGEGTTDTQILAQASRRSEANTCFRQFSKAIAPGLIASALDSLRPLVDFVTEQCNPELGLADQNHTESMCLIETAGGWFSPITSCHDVRDFAAQLGGDVLLVGPSSLGAINQVTLTAHAIAACHLRIAAIILSHRPNADAELAELNRTVLQERLGTRTVLLANQADAKAILAML